MEHAWHVQVSTTEADFVGATAFVEVSPTSLHEHTFRPRRNGEGPHGRAVLIAALEVDV